MLTQFAELLKNAIGLDARSIGPHGLERALRERQLACRAEDLPAYWRCLHERTGELQALVEAVTVPETWFFRERGAFAALVAALREKWPAPDADRGLRILSLPCSTGEEAYSIAMALLDAGLPPGRFHIDAIDISERGLEAARRAVYRRHSFRGTDQAFRARYFKATSEGYELREPVRRQVNFRKGNLLANDTLPDTPYYDAIFCRNLLIYFDVEMQDRAIAILLRALRKNGLLFVGSSESALLLAHGLTPLKMAMSFGFRRPERRAAAPPIKPIRQPTPMPRPPPKPLMPSAPAMPCLDEASRLADLGQLERAALLCERHVRLHGPSAQALHLLGLVQDARGNAELAADYYRRVLYLNPRHGEALAHLASLLEQRGDSMNAARLRRRLDRLTPRGSSR